jgi:CxxC motif-containing protein (DUF1111 family)
MKYSYPAWYLCAALLVFVPVGVRVLTWRSVAPAATSPDMVRAGEDLFKHEWQPNDPLCPDGDGLGPVFNARSCVACHNQGGVGVGGGSGANVTLFTAPPARKSRQRRQGVLHRDAVTPDFQETFAHVDPSLAKFAAFQAKMLPMKPKADGREIEEPELPRNTGPAVTFSRRNTPALFGARLIDEIPERVILAEERRQRLRFGVAADDGDGLSGGGRARRLADGRVGRFGWKAQGGSLAGFVEAACANELGLGNPGQAQPTPLGRSDYRPAGLDLTQAQCDQLTAFVAALPRPIEKLPGGHAEVSKAVAGKRLFKEIGCANCHTPNLGAALGLYSDLLMHRMGQGLGDNGGSGFYGAPPPPVLDGPTSPPDTFADEWRTPPLWGVADSGPYLHDGRAKTLADAIRLHGGQASAAALRYASLGPNQQEQVLAFLGTLRAP